MLTDNQKKYLANIPRNRTVRIFPFDATMVKKITDSILDRVRSSISEVWPIQFLGSSALGISGQKDIEVFIVCPSDSFQPYIPMLMKEFGSPNPWIKGTTSIGWEWEEDGYNIELYLTDPKAPETIEQLQVFEILKENPALKAEFENLKLGFDGKSYRDYQKAKYRFFNRILDK